MVGGVSSLLDTSTVIVGQSGSGKTVTAKHQVQQLLDQRRHVAIVDPTGVWWGMRAQPGGEPNGAELYIFGGEHGDVAIRPDQGAAIARIIVEQRVSAIVDLSGIDNSADWRLFAHDFVAELRRAVNGNFHLVVDEADEFAAERVADDVGFRLRENMVWIAKRGRVRGFVPTYITQRTAEIAKAVISQAQTLIAHQLISPADRKAIDDYLKGHGSAETRKSVMDSLAQLAVGDRWVYSPRLKVLDLGQTPPLATFDSSRTPGPGETLAQPRRLAELDVTAIRAALAPDAGTYPDDTIPAEPAEAYRKGGVVGTILVERDERIADLEAANALLRATAETVAERGNRRMSSLRAGLIAAISDLEALVARVDRDLAGTEADGTPEPVADPAAAATAAATSDREYRALGTLAAIAPAGLTEAGWAQRAGYSRKGGAWQDRRRRYVANGLIEQRDGRWYATVAGIAAAGADTPQLPPPGPALVYWWARRMGAAGRLLQLLASVHPKALTREAIAAELRMSAKGGAFGAKIQELRAAELIVERSKRLTVAPALMGEAE